MKKRSIAVVIGISMMMAFSACGTQTGSSSAAKTTAGTETAVETVTATEKATASEKETASETAQSVSGGWEINQGNLDPSANKEAKAAFEKATADLDGYEYELIAVLGSQVVAGTNYSYLCRGSAVTPDAQKEYFVVNVYQDLEGNAKITGTKNLLTADGSDGGWSYNQGEYSIDENQDVKKAFETSLKDIKGKDYEAVAYIGSQITSGTNYAIFCREGSPVQDPEQIFTLVTVSQDANGNAEISEIQDIDIDTQNSTTDGNETEEISQIPDPFTEVSTLEKAAGITGFSMSVPDVTEDYPDMIIRVMDSSMIEVIYENKANETEDGTDELYRIRKAAGTDDISGDYNEYSNVRSEKIGDNDVTLKGNGDAVSVATWSAGEYSYAVDAEDHPLTAEQAEKIIEAVK